MSTSPLAGARRALALLAMVATPAFAAEGRAPDTLVVPIEGVTVTGNRAPETVLKSPAAVTVVPRSRFEATRNISLADGLERVPGVFSQSRAGAQDARITIRGFGARGNGERSNSGNMRGIRILTDGIPLTEPDGRTSLDFVDLGGTDKIEVLRSNGSVLYGNASGGVVNLRTSMDFASPYAELKAHGGEFGYHREQAVAGYMLGRAHAVTSLYNSNFDGWRQHSESRTTSIQNRIGAPVSDHSQLGLLLDFVTNLNRYPGPLTQAQFDADPQQANAAFVSRDERRFNRVGRVGVTLEHDLPDEQRLTVMTFVEPKVLQRSERNRFRDFTRYHAGGGVTYQVVTPLSSSMKATWSAGADEQYQDGSIQFYDLNPDGSRGTTLIANKREGANSAGGFVQGELLINGQWGVRAAARYDNLWYIAEDRIDPTLNASKKFTQITPKGSVARYLGDHTIYASVGGSIEAPAFNEIDPPPPYDAVTSLNPFLDPMRSTSYEAGMKGRMSREGSWIGRVGYDAALYWIDIKNEIVPFDGGAYFFTAGKSRRRGGELAVDWTPVPMLTLSGSGTVSKNEYVEYVNDLGDFGGNEVPGLPEVFFDGEARWRVLPGLSVAGNLKYVGSYFADDANTAEAGGFTLLGALAEYAVPSPFGLVKAFISASNLTDETYVASVFINGINNEYYEAGLPRNVSGGVTLTLR